MTNAQATHRNAAPARELPLQEQYKALNPHLRAAMLHARTDRSRERPEPCGGDSAMD